MSAPADFHPGVRVNLSRALTPVAILAAVILLGLVGVIWFAARYENRMALQENRISLETVIRNTVEGQAQALEGAASADTMSSPAELPFDVIASVEAEGEPARVLRSRRQEPGFEASLTKALYAQGTWSELVRSGPAANGARREDSASFMRVGARVYLVSIRPVAVQSGRFVIGLSALDGAMLHAWQSEAQISGIELVDWPRPGATTDCIPLGRKQDSAFLEFRPERPGDRMFAQAAALLVAFSTVFSAVIAYHARRVTLELVVNEAAARRAATHDILSGLPNRLLFTQLLDSEIARVRRYGGAMALMYLDLDRFKEINDQYGHDAGDKLIISVAQRMGEAMRGSDRIARFGGDEFAVLVTDIESSLDCEIVARRLLQAMKAPFDLGGKEAFAGMSIGIALFQKDASDREELMRLADLALYRAKADGRNRFAFFEPHMNEDLRVRKSAEVELRHAIESDQLRLHYQPVFDSAGQQIVGVEALVRWMHPERGLVPPAQFIGLAEDRGLIMRLGEWVLRRACLDAAAWPELRVAVNVSPVQFRNRAFVETVSRILEEARFEPARLEIEITEGVVIDDADQAEEAITKLRAMGVRLALDDFGIGYSSLIYLRRFALDKIKIDRSFLESLQTTGESAIILHSVIHLGRALGLTVTAEGVETAEQHRFLQALGCHEMQGFLFARPVDAATISALLASRSAIAAEGQTTALRGAA